MIFRLLLGCALAPPALAGGLIDINRADAEALDRLPGIGPSKAETLIAWRSLHGPCVTLDDLLEVPGIGAATLAALRGRAYCGESQAAASGAVTLASPTLPARVNVNTADTGALMVLPGMFRQRAEAIVAERERGGPFQSCADLERVPGIGRATVAALSGLCTTGP